MRIKTRLLLSSTIMIGGLALVVSLSLYAIHGIKTSITQLTAHSTPLQIKTTELQKSVEGLAGNLLRLGVANDTEEVRQLSAAIDGYKRTMDTIVQDIDRLNAGKGSQTDTALYRNLHETVQKAVEERLKNIALFKKDAEDTDSSFAQVERALDGIRQEMGGLVETGSSRVSGAVKSSAQLFGSANTVKDIMLDLREIQVTLNGLDLARSKAEVLALKQKIKNINNSIQGAAVDEPIVKEVKSSANAIFDQFIRPNGGLISLKMELLSGTGNEAHFQALKKQILDTLTDKSLRLAAVTDIMENRVDKNRREVDTALGTRQKITIVTNTVAATSADMKSLETKVRILMLSDTDAAYEKSVHDISTLIERLKREISLARKEILPFQQEKLTRSIESAVGAQRRAEVAIERIVATQKKILDSTSLVNKTMAQVRETTFKEVKAGEERLKETANSQETMVTNVTAMVKRMSFLILTISLIVAALAIIGMCIVIARVTSSLQRLVAMLKDIAQGEGDLTKRLDEGSKDEFGEAAHWFNLFLDKLVHTIGGVAQNVAELTSSSGRLNSSAEQIASGADRVAGQAMTASTAAEEMSATSGDIAQNCQLAAEGAQRANAAAEDGAKVVNNTVQVMNRIAARVNGAAQAIALLEQRSDSINAIIGTIQDIADQTNLLALNAAIEAARAGEQGRGFAVVADEVRALAERTTTATKEVGDMIRAIQNETRQAVTTMNNGVKEVECGTVEAGKSGQSLTEILDQIGSATLQISQIATAAEQQTATSSEISKTMLRVTDIAQQSADGAKESATAASSLARLAENLHQLVGQFKLA